MSLSNRVSDEALSQAKRRSDPEVNRAHVLLALLTLGIAGGDRRDQLIVDVETVLGPHGSAIDAPNMTDEARDAVAACATAPDLDAAFTELVNAVMPSPSGTASATALPDSQSSVTPSSDEREQSSTASDADSLDVALADLDALVGLDAVKAAIAALVATHRFNAERSAALLPSVPVGLHLVFTGSPGTGKTTVARIVARIYRHLGLLSSGHLVETDRSGLVAGYVGQTALQTRDTVRRALGGVLFIDEAYALAGAGGDHDYGAEAVATLVKAMEDQREDLAVIMAGYPAEMARFISSNSGLRSRFQRYLEFVDYSDEELLEIFVRRAIAVQIRITTPVREGVLAFIASAPPEFRDGNGRFIRNLFEEMYACMAARAGADDVFEEHELTEFSLADVPPAFSIGDAEPPTGLYL